MDIEYKGKKYKVKYIHERLVSDGKIQARGGTTIAFITDEKTKMRLGTGQSYVSMKDTYIKRLGRIISTGRLLKNLGIPRTHINWKNI